MENAPSAVGAGMGIGADDEVAGHAHAALGQKRVLNTRAALLPVVGDVLVVREITHLLGLLGALDVLVGRIVVRHQAHAIAVEDVPGAQLVEDVDGDRRGDVVGEHQVQVALDQLPRPHLVQAGVRRQDLLGHGHGSCHSCFPSVVAGPSGRPVAGIESDYLEARSRWSEIRRFSAFR